MIGRPCGEIAFSVKFYNENYRVQIYSWSKNAPTQLSRCLLPPNTTSVEVCQVTDVKVEMNVKHFPIIAVLKCQNGVLRCISDFNYSLISRIREISQNSSWEIKKRSISNVLLSAFPSHGGGRLHKTQFSACSNP